MTDATEKYTATTEFMQEIVQSLKTKQEILIYLTAVKDFCATSMKIVRAYMKGCK